MDSRTPNKQSTDTMRLHFLKIEVIFSGTNNQYNIAYIYDVNPINAKYNEWISFKVKQQILAASCPGM